MNTIQKLALKHGDMSGDKVSFTWEQLSAFTDDVVDYGVDTVIAADTKGDARSKADYDREYKETLERR